VGARNGCLFLLGASLRGTQSGERNDATNCSRAAGKFLTYTLRTIFVPCKGQKSTCPRTVYVESREEDGKEDEERRKEEVRDTF
jgi:hypothetical protein